MKKLILKDCFINENINENITNSERQYRQFIGMVQANCPKADLAGIQIIKTTKGNWLVCDANLKKLCLLSRNIIDQSVLEKYGINVLDSKDLTK